MSFCFRHITMYVFRPAMNPPSREEALFLTPEGYSTFKHLLRMHNMREAADNRSHTNQNQTRSINLKTHHSQPVSSDNYYRGNYIMKFGVPPSQYLKERNTTQKKSLSPDNITATDHTSSFQHRNPNLKDHLFSKNVMVSNLTSSSQNNDVYSKEQLPGNSNLPRMPIAATGAVESRKRQFDTFNFNLEINFDDSPKDVDNNFCVTSERSGLQHPCSDQSLHNDLLVGSSFSFNSASSTSAKQLDKKRKFESETLIESDKYPLCNSKRAKIDDISKNTVVETLPPLTQATTISDLFIYSLPDAGNESQKEKCMLLESQATDFESIQ